MIHIPGCGCTHGSCFPSCFRGKGELVGKVNGFTLLESSGVKIYLEYQTTEVNYQP